MKQIFTILLLALFSFSNAQTTSDFENFNLAQDSSLNGDDLSGGFTAGNIFLPNNFNSNYGSWSGWSISSRTDVTTPGFMNDLSAITGSGFDGSLSYAVAFIFGPQRIILEGAAAGEVVEGFYITNGTYPFLSMRDGDGFAKKFGGISGDDPDYFLLTIKAYSNGQLSTDSVDFYLADYRFEDNTQDYIVNEWTYVDLTSLGNVDSLDFKLSSTDVGAYGMNTPAYFCIDNFKTTDGVSSVNSIAQSTDFELFPNPALEFFNVKNKNQEVVNISFFDITGRLLVEKTSSNYIEQINISSFPKGSYFVKIQTEENILTDILIKN